MTTAAPPVALQARFATELPELSMAWEAAEAPEPRLLVLNETVAAELGIDPGALRSPEGVQFLLGRSLPEGARPVAQGYAGHQFGNWSPRLGDGRALLLGEVQRQDGSLRDIHLKGSGRTPFSRGADGKAVVGPMLREHVISEALHALGIPTTRALAVVWTGERVLREGPQPGAVLVRVAASHLRVGMFQYAASLGDAGLLGRLADHAIARHHPGASSPLELLDAVVGAQASLVARWMQVAFVHGVMNTDNVTISGETIDYGPCAFMEAFDPRAVFSSIDAGARYAYGNQPTIMQWNLTRLAEALLPLVGSDTDAAIAAVTPILETFGERFLAAWQAGLRDKLGLPDVRPEDGELFEDLLRLLYEQEADMTSAFRALGPAARGDDTSFAATLKDPAAGAGWLAAWRVRLDGAAAEPGGEAGSGTDALAARLDAANPALVPRNALVEEALAAATAGDIAPYEALVERVTRPFEPRAGDERYLAPAPREDAPVVTYCGT